MSVKGGLPAKRTLDACSSALKVPPATGVGVGLGGEPQPRTGTLSGFDVGFAVGERSAQASGIVTREGRNRQIAVSAASRARPDAQQMQLDFSQEQQEALDFCVSGFRSPDRKALYLIYHNEFQQGKVTAVGRRAYFLWSLALYRESQRTPGYPAAQFRNQSGSLSDHLRRCGGLAAAW